MKIECGAQPVHDPRENAWHRNVCNGTLTLRQAQKLELAYKRKYG